MIRYEVDLRERATGNSIKTIFSADDHGAAWDFVDKWNREHIPDYNKDCSPCEYVDGSQNGFVADCYEVDVKGDVC